MALMLAPPARAEGPACGAPPESLNASALAGTATAVNRGNLRVMVVGSASTHGGGTSGPQATWPERFARVLTARMQNVTVEVRTYGARGTVAADHSRVMAEHGPGYRPHLVIWQLGPVEAARGLSAEEMAETVKSTAARIRAARGERTDVILMDPQFSRFLRANADVEVYRDRLKMAAAASGAQLFSRYEIMRYWSENERLDLERAPREARTRIADELHDCLARALVEFVLEGVRDTR
ncbi:SGNH/GDSL hydrolase family protein [Leptolyngbya sp. 15MV]|nr:SGNH/GDSL hydrolase family protein [Leptolyngbya sp. 15MV]